MLAALGNGVKGNKWFSLIDKVYRLAALQAAWEQVKANRGAAGIDGHPLLKERIEERISDGRLLGLLAGWPRQDGSFRSWMDSSGEDYGRYCASGKSVRALESATPITNAGRMFTSLHQGCSP